MTTLDLVTQHTYSARETAQRAWKDFYKIKDQLVAMKHECPASITASQLVLDAIAVSDAILKIDDIYHDEVNHKQEVDNAKAMLGQVRVARLMAEGLRAQLDRFQMPDLAYKVGSVYSLLHDAQGVLYLALTCAATK